MVEARGIEPLSLGESEGASTGLADWIFSAAPKAVHHLAPPSDHEFISPENAVTPPSG